MKKLKIDTLGVTQLNNELHSLLTEEAISFSVKYDIAKLLDKTKVIAERYNKLRTEIIIKYGVKVEGENDNYTLDGSDKAETGFKELEALGEKVEQIESTFKIEDFKDLKSKYPYYIIFKLF